MTTIRIGAGAGFSGDRIEPAVDLAERGELASLHQLVLRVAQRALRILALADLGRQPGVRPGQLGGALRHQLLELLGRAL